MVLGVTTAIFAFGYAILVLFFAKGWRKLTKRSELAPVSNNKDAVHSLALLIPFRNESKHLPFLIDSIDQLILTGIDLEVIWINDQSEDSSELLIENAIKVRKSWKLLRTTPDFEGKKAALTLGVLSTVKEWIVCTDADCSMNPFWLLDMLKVAEAENADVVSGPVLLKAFNWFERLQSLEFMSLNAIGASCIELRNPVIVNGANWMYKREAWLKVDGFKAHQQLASGDDDLLMHQFLSKGYKISFCLKKGAIVETQACKTFQELLNQRLRWISKSGRYSRKDITLILASVWIYLALVVCLAMAGHWLIALVLWLVKWTVDGWFLRSVSEFYGLRNSLKWLSLVQVFYLPYVLVVGLLGNFSFYQWKGRRHRPMKA